MRRLVAPSGVDAPAVNAALIAAIHHLALAAAASGRFAGTELTSDADWARMRSAISALIAGVYPA
jgi:DNA-binding transcriptional regulator YdaS (Cro superfamily)